MISQLLESPETRVREAIERCLEACHRDRAPLAKLAECVETLKTEGWEAAEIHRVELPVLKMLVALMSPDRGTGDSDVASYW